MSTGSWSANVAFLTLLSLAAPTGAQQRPPIVTGSVDFFPYSSLDNPAPGTFEETIETEISNPRITLNLPARIGPRGAFVSSINFAMLRFTYRGAVFPGVLAAPDKLYDISYRAVLNLPLAPGWRISLIAEPGIASDMEGVSANHFKIQGGAILTRPLEDGSIGFGALVQNQFGEVLPLPVVTYTKRTERIAVDARLPKRAEFLYRPTPQVGIGVAGSVTGNRFRRGSSVTLIEDPVIRYSAVTFGPILEIRFTPAASARFIGGLAPFRRFEITDQTSSTLRTFDLEPVAFARVGVNVMPRFRRR